MHNFIIEFQDAFPDHFCDELIAKFEQSESRHEGRTGAGVDKQKKHSWDLDLSHNPQWQEQCRHINGVVEKALAHYAKAFPMLVTGAVSPSGRDPKTGHLKTIQADHLAAMPIENVEQITQAIFRLDHINMQRYSQGIGGYPHWHSEQYPHPDDTNQRSLHRVLLWLAYLNDVPEGGETEFLYQEAKIKPKKGSLVLAPCGFTHTHRGNTPRSNDKYVLASWVMYKPASELYQNG